MGKVLLRERLVTLEQAALKLNIHEVGGDNHGPWMKKFLAEVGLPEGYAWCDADQSYFEHEAAGHRLPIESASVLQTWNTAVRLGWTVKTPARGDLVCYRWTGSGAPFGDHIGLVVKATSVGAFWKLQTIEGNTSSGTAGSQGNGDGMYARTRLISKSQVGFVRIPGTVDLQPVKKLVHPAGKQLPAKKAPAKKPASKPAAAAHPTVKRGDRGAAVEALQRLLDTHGSRITVDGIFGPSTANSVRAFQKRSRLTVDGIVGPKTWAALTAKGSK